MSRAPKTLTLVVNGVEMSPAEAMRRMNEAAIRAADEMRDEVEDDGWTTLYPEELPT